MYGAISVVVKGYPRLAETFVAQELLGLQRRGIDLRIYSLRRPYDPASHPIHDEISAPVTYLPEYLHDAPARVIGGWRRARRLPGYARARAAFQRDLKRDPTRSRLRRFGQACILAAEMPAEVTWLYAHFLHTPASVARYAAIMRELPYSVSAHAKDVWTTPEWEKRGKIADARWLVTCTDFAAAHLAALADRPDKVHRVYHGLDGRRFPPRPATAASKRTGAHSDDAVRILSVGRPVAKKGYDVLLAALALLPRELHWRFVHIGRGELSNEIEAMAQRLGLAGRIEWLGAQPAPTVLARLREADLFVLASRVAADGDRDGLPNVLLEAQSQRLACIATTVSGIPELIHDNETGRLVPEGDPDVLARAMMQLITDPAARARLGAAGEARVRRQFDADAGIDDIAHLLGAPAAGAAAAQ